MSFTHLPHDDCAYRHRLLESIGPGEYALDKTFTKNCGACFVPSAGVRLGGFGVSVCDGVGERTDVDSELIGLRRTHSKCPGKQLVERAKKVCDTHAPRECNDLDPENCRLSNPPCTLRGRGWNRFEYLCKNPQARLDAPYASDVSTRLLAKDTFRPCARSSADS